MRGEFLLINNNNTRTKFALSSRDDLLDYRVIKTSNVSSSSVSELLADWDYDKVVMASVVPRDVPTLTEVQQGRPLVEVSHDIALGVEIDFPKPSCIGADRLANA